MKRIESVLIVEEEIHLAQSIMEALGALGYQCQSVPDISTPCNRDYDVVLISAGACVDRCERFVRQNAQAITIMMASFVSEEGVNRPIQAGARDYILKPFKMEELIRKITYHKSYKEAITRARVHDKYLDFVARHCGFDCEHTPPFVLHSPTQNAADIFMLHYARTHNLDLDFLSLKDTHWLDIPPTPCPTYITHLEILPRPERRKFLKTLYKHHAIVSCVGGGPVEFDSVVSLGDASPTIPLQLVSIQEYEKNAIRQFGQCYTDTELAKRLGISRKSLWEKRRRYNLPKKPVV